MSNVDVPKRKYQNSAEEKVSRLQRSLDIDTLHAALLRFNFLHALYYESRAVSCSTYFNKVYDLNANQLCLNIIELFRSILSPAFRALTLLYRAIYY